MNKIELFKHISKSIFILALLSFLLTKISICLHKYIENPTYTTSKLVNQNEADFPALTICPMGRHDGYKENMLKSHGIAQLEFYSISYFSKICPTNLNWSSNYTDVSEDDLFDQATLKFDELVESFAILPFQNIYVSL